MKARASAASSPGLKEAMTMSDMADTPEFKEAVEAGAEAAYEAVRFMMRFPTDFGEAPEHIQYTYRKLAAAALTAGLAKLGSKL